MRKTLTFLLTALLLSLPAGAVPDGSDVPEGDAADPEVDDGRPPVGPLFVTGEAVVPYQALPEALPSLSAQSCNACHGALFEEWADSGHGDTWHSPLYREALAAAGTPTYCLRCHLPLENQRAELIRGYDEATLAKPKLDPNPRFAPTLRGEGVTCAACHVRDGQIYGPRTLRPGESPHPVSHHPDLGESVTCAACHQLTWPGTEEQPLYDTYREWQGSAWAQAGVGCQDCHMPLMAGPVSGERFAAHRSHRIHGSADDATLARAVTVQLGTLPARLQRGSELPIRIQVMNTGAGHHLPTGNPHAWVEVRLVVDGVEGWSTDPVSWPLRREVDLEGEHTLGEDTRIPAGGVATFEHTVTPGKRATAPSDLRVRVELVYHRLPTELAELHEQDPAAISRVFHAQEVLIPLR